jgi:hypothetical protein
MKSKKLRRFLCYVLVSFIALLMSGFLGFGVRAFVAADTSQFIFSAASIVSVAILVLCFMLRRHRRESTVHSLFREPQFVKRFLFPGLSTIGGSPLTLDHVSGDRPTPTSS